MQRTLRWLIVLAAVAGNSSWGQEGTQSSPDEAAIRQSVATYTAAFNEGDAKALADQWSPDAVYTSRVTGEEVVGRAKIVEQFTALFKEQSKLKIEINVESIQFVSPNVAVEHGRAKTFAPQAEPEETAYTAVYVKRDGRWLLDRVTDEPSQVAPSNYEQLKALDWMIGQWRSEAESAQVELECNWTKNRNFLTRSFKLARGDGADFAGMQVIGWDPAAKTIRSWTFDSNGTFAEATWKRQGERWFIHNTGVLPDGRKATMVNVMKPVDERSFTWQTIERTAGGDLLPNIDEVVIVRH